MKADWDSVHPWNGDIEEFHSSLFILPDGSVRYMFGKVHSTALVQIYDHAYEEGLTPFEACALDRVAFAMIFAYGSGVRLAVTFPSTPTAKQRAAVLEIVKRFDAAMDWGIDPTYKTKVHSSEAQALRALDLED